MQSPFSSETQTNAWGYHELRFKPDKSALKAYYEERYYQDEIRTHRASYSEQELQYRHNKCAQKAMLAERHWQHAKPVNPTLLDIGAGEGFVMNYFAQVGYAVVGIDYSQQGCKNHHPHLLNQLRTGDIEEVIAQVVQEGATFDLVVLDNVLEHLLDAGWVLSHIAALLNPGGLLIIEVPNDFSFVQNHLLANQTIPKPFWVASPDHISYFNADGLNQLLASHGFDNKEILGDFPIDLFLFNERTNYVTDKQAGKSCHQARIDIENLLHQHNPQATLDMYASMGKLGLGRQIVGVYGLSQHSDSSSRKEAV
jgi:2-polyprenyl-3-methyl-5-hydroxy-6-metoxy-1,4-benzoquinol methylase